MAGSWLEITNRDDLGANLKAPQTDESGKEYWSYSLLKAVKEGDRVLHYHKRDKAIVASSRALGSPYEDSILWSARGASARALQTVPHIRPGWSVGLEDFRVLATPVTLEELRTLENEIRDLLGIGSGSEALYLPFAFSAKRPLRPSQGYLTRWPEELNALLGLDPVLVEIPPTADTNALGADYRRADEEAAVSTREPFEIDPAVIERGVRSHALTQNLLADFLQKNGVTPRSPRPGEPNYDLAWEFGNKLIVTEVKSLSLTNEERQLRLGLGQVLRYRQILASSGDAVAVLAVPYAPSDEGWLTLCELLKVSLVWPSKFDDLQKRRLLPPPLTVPKESR